VCTRCTVRVIGLATFGNRTLRRRSSAVAFVDKSGKERNGEQAGVALTWRASLVPHGGDANDSRGDGPAIRTSAATPSTSGSTSIGWWDAFSGRAKSDGVTVMYSERREERYVSYPSITM